MRFLRDLLRDESGLAAVEWAFVGPMFLFLLLAIIDLGITFTTQATMDGAARDAARLIRTGQLQANGGLLLTFQNQLCGEMTMFMTTASCQTNVAVDVVTVSGTTNFSSLPAFTNCFNSTVTPPPVGACPFNPGGAGDLVGVQVTYNRAFLVPWVGTLLASSSDPQHIKLQSTVVFRNEPF